MKELVSVIVTTRNEERNIERFWKSIKSQSYKNIECITIDNKSRDKTKEIAKKYSKVYDKGPERSAQRNFGARKAKGKYVLFLDADMELTKNVIAESVNNFKGNIGMINELIIHHELIDSLWLIAKKKYYYCLSLGRYMNKSKKLAKRQAKVFLRKAYLNNWKEFLKRPDLTYGFIIMRIAEAIGALIGLYAGKIRDKKKFLPIIQIS